LYSNAFTGALRPDTNGNDTRTIIETQSFNRMTIPETPMVTGAPSAAVEVHPLAIDAPKVGSSIQNLCVVEIRAYPCGDYIACSEEELSFKHSNWINSVTQLTKLRYHGSFDGTWGYFDRRMVRISFALDPPLQTHIVRNPLNGRYLTCKHGDSLFITVSINNPSVAIISDPKPAHSA
jgi:hypothetical protein